MPYPWTNLDVLDADELNEAVGPPIFNATQSVSQSIPNNAATPVTFPTEDVDSHNGHSTVTNTSRYTAPVAGWYQVSGGISWPSNATGSREAGWLINGNQVAGSALRFTPVAALRIYPARTILVHLSIGDYVELYGFQDSGGALSTDVSGGHFRPSMSVVCVRLDAV